MPISSAEIVYRLSVVAAAGDTTVSTPAASLGDQVSTTVLTAATLHNLFDVVTGAEAAAGSIDYRCVFVLNNNATLTLFDAKASFVSQTAGGSTMEMGVDPTAASAKGSASAQAVTIANESTAPAGVTFSAGPVNLGDLAPGQVRALWLRRTTTAGAGGINQDGAIFQVLGDTLQ